MNGIIFLAFELTAVLLLTLYVIKLEREERRHDIFLLLVGVFLFELTIAGHASNTPFGILRPRFGGQDFRPPDLVIAAVFLARMLNPTRRRFTPESLLWIVFLAWYTAMIVPGVVNGAVLNQALFQGKAAFYLIGTIMVGSGADLRRLADNLRRVAPILVVVVLVAIVFATLKIRISVSTPVQRLPLLGRLGNDSITIYTALGALLVVIEAHRKDARMRYFLCGGILLLSPFAGFQRASYAVLLVLALVAVGFSQTPTFRRRRTISATHTFVAVVAVAAVATLALTVGPGRQIVTTRVDDAFGGQAEVNSALARIDLADQAVNKIQERPLLGWGLGATVTRVAIAGNKTAQAAAHNVVLDVLLRSGVVGFGLLVVALFGTVRLGLRRWRTARDPVEAGVYLGALHLLAAFLAKASIEPGFDKYRLAILAGLAIGVLVGHRPEAPVVGDEEEAQDAGAVVARAAGPTGLS